MKTRTKGLVLLILITLLMGLLTACNPPAEKKNSISINFEYMDELLALKNFKNLGVYKLLYDSLFYIDEFGAIQPELVSEYTVENNQIFTLNIKENVKFHDGTELNAADVTDNLLRLSMIDYKGSFDSGEIRTAGIIGTAGNDVLHNISTVELMGTHKLRIVLEQPSSFFMYYLTFGVIPALNPEGLTEAPKTQVYKTKEDFHLVYGMTASNVQMYESNTDIPIGSGPYQVNMKPEEYTNSINKKVAINLSAFPEYWQGKAKIEEAILKQYDIPYTYMLRGDVDLVALRSLNSFSALKGMENYQKMLESKILSVAKYQQLNTTRTMAFNCNVEPMDNLAVRQALAYAIDGDALLIAMQEDDNMTGVVSAQYLSEDNIAFQPIKNTYKFDLEEATRLLKEAGLSDGFTLRIDEDVLQKWLSKKAQQELEKQLDSLKIKVEWTGFDESHIVLTSEASPYFLFKMESWIPWVKDFSNKNPTNKINEQLDLILKEALSTADLARQIELFTQMLEMIGAEAIFIPLISYDYYYPYNNQIAGLNFSYPNQVIMSVRTANLIDFK